MKKTPTQLIKMAMLFVLVASQKVIAQDPLEARVGESLFGPFPHIQTVRGVQLSTPVSALISLAPEGDSWRINGRVVVDLADLQQKVGALVDTIPLPRDNCARFSLDNVVATIWGKRITIEGSAAVLRLSGDLDIWTCLENPIPCTRVEWDGLIPRVETFACNPPIKNRNVNQPFDATIPLRLSLPDSQTVAVALGAPEVRLGGTASALTEKILEILRVNLDQKVKEALDEVIDLDRMKASFPNEIRNLHPVLTQAEWLSYNGTLAALLEMNATVDAAALGELSAALRKAQ